jgi:hypothetical protein
LEISIASIGASGDILKGAGYLASATGVGASIGLPLIGMGNTLSTTSSLLRTGQALAQGKTDAAIYNGLSAALGSLGTSSIRYSNYSTIDKIILNFWIDVVKTPMDKTIGTSIERSEQ